ncbi:MAG: hypothetical protein R2939_06045 [Kofleriaceae bacterium]
MRGGDRRRARRPARRAEPDARRRGAAGLSFTGCTGTHGVDHPRQPVETSSDGEHLRIDARGGVGRLA